jgi:hypothetical protein
MRAVTPNGSNSERKETVVRLKQRAMTFVALVLAVTTAVSVAGAVPAMADSSMSTLGNAGSANFTSYGEHLTIYDDKADGHSVVVLNVRQDLCCAEFEGWNHNGAKSFYDYNLDMPEGDWIDYYVCLGEYASRTILWNTCGGHIRDYA